MMEKVEEGEKADYCMLDIFGCHIFLRSPFRHFRYLTRFVLHTVPVVSAHEPVGDSRKVAGDGKGKGKDGKKKDGKKKDKKGKDKKNGKKNKKNGKKQKKKKQSMGLPSLPVPHSITTLTNCTQSLPSPDQYARCLRPLRG